ncbi:MAG TPA: zf-TFIIB domain-containing protein [Polyangiaceae bacterium]|nr:zf-TFIIB domain-containing protein [Polyangiaceae bacterium]
MSIMAINVAEEEYFRSQEADQRREEAWDDLRRANQAEQARLKAGGLGLCPECKTRLERRTLRGVELDQCGSCRGSWIKAGELQQLGTQKQRCFLAKVFAFGRGGVDK